jgi:hypothetical protein
MNPNAAIFYPQEVYSQTSSTIPYMSSVIENLLFDNLENDFIKNNTWLFEETKAISTPSNEDEESKREAFYEEQNERLLAMEQGEYDCGQCDEDVIEETKQKTFTVKSRKGKIIIITLK